MSAKEMFEAIKTDARRDHLTRFGHLSPLEFELSQRAYVRAWLRAEWCERVIGLSLAQWLLSSEDTQAECVRVLRKAEMVEAGR